MCSFVAMLKNGTCVGKVPNLWPLQDGWQIKHLLPASQPVHTINSRGLINH